MKLREEVAAKGHKWTVNDEMEIAKLPLEEKRKRLGLQKSEPQPGVAVIGPELAKVIKKKLGAAPAKWDWRNATANGKTGDWTTPVRDQQNCGSCAAFSSTAAIEESWKINVARDTGKTIDLSEWDIFTRGGGSCQSGSDFEKMLEAAEKGQCDESCYPYLTSNPRCNDYANRLTFTKSHTRLNSEGKMKAWISIVGPIMVGMNVPEDMFYYSGGIYHWESGDIVGGHGICIEGYNDQEQYWIIKNSWGTEWGESGRGRMDYQSMRDMGMLSQYPAFGVTMNGQGPGPTPPTNPDLTIPVDGQLTISLQLTKTTTDSILVMNGKEICKISEMTYDKPVMLGKFKKGDKVQFDLKDVPHKNQCWPSGWRIWTLRVAGGLYQFRLQEIT
jgi:hypothetical protein